MEHKIKELAEAITNSHTSDLVQSHVKELKFEDNLKNLMDENKTSGRIKKLGNSFLEKYYEGGK